MATISAIESLVANIDWDEAWANRDNSGSYINWYILDKAGNVVSEDPASGVKIINQNTRSALAVFDKAGSFIAKCVVCDGAMLAYAEKNIEIKLTTDGDGNHETNKVPVPPATPGSTNTSITIPITIKIPTGEAIFKKCDCVIDMDTTGSMGSAIKTATVRAEEIVSKLREKGSLDGLYAVTSFRDVGDSYVTRVDTPLTTSVEAVTNALSRLQANGGGDGPEAQIPSIYRNCIDSSSNAIKWRDNALHVYIQFTDASAHDPRDGVSGSEAIDAMLSRNIKFIGINCGGGSSTETYLTRMANATGGAYYALGTSAEGIANAIADALSNMSQNLTVRIVPVGPAVGIVKSINPSTHNNISPGDSFTFNITFDSSGVAIGTGATTYIVNAEILAEDLALLDTIPFEVTVNWP